MGRVASPHAINRCGCVEADHNTFCSLRRTASYNGTTCAAPLATKKPSWNNGLFGIFVRDSSHGSVALAGAHNTKVIENVVTGNVASGPSIATGGIAVLSTVALWGTDPVGNLIKPNKLAGNLSDLFHDGLAAATSSSRTRAG